MSAVESLSWHAEPLQLTSALCFGVAAHKKRRGVSSRSPPPLCSSAPRGTGPASSEEALSGGGPAASLGHPLTSGLWGFAQTWGTSLPATATVSSHDGFVRFLLRWQTVFTFESDVAGNPSLRKARALHVGRGGSHGVGISPAK